jgi:AbrB family looped-hinge helix DNA binding protein
MGEGGSRGFRGERDGCARSSEAEPKIRKAARTSRRFLTVGENGRIELPADLAKAAGAGPGSRLEVRERDGRLEIRPDIHSLSRLYIEPTSRCNLTCRTCIRNSWAEPLGDMSDEVFGRIEKQLGDFPHLRSVMFGGFGEPTVHPSLLNMIAAIRRHGVKAELTTNGTRLDEALVEGLFAAGLDRLWVSIDGANTENFDGIRRGAGLRGVLDGLGRVQERNEKTDRPIGIGLSFVVLRRNVADLAAMDELARSVGADTILVSNVLPYSAEMEKEMLCALTLSTDTFASAAPKIEMRLPRIDIAPATRETILLLLRGFGSLTLMGNPINAETDYCRFIEGRTTFIRWDGAVAPCLGLLHGLKTFLYGYERSIKPHVLGHVGERALPAIWDSEEYRAFREKVRDFDFSPCHLCGGCSLLDTNDEDCFGNAFPACGGCLWAQGVIQCP